MGSLSSWNGRVSESEEHTSLSIQTAKRLSAQLFWSASVQLSSTLAEEQYSALIVVKDIPWSPCPAPLFVPGHSLLSSVIRAGFGSCVRCQGTRRLSFTISPRWKAGSETCVCYL